MSADSTLAATGGPAVESSPGAGELASGTAVGRYIVLGKLGAGAMGVVYSAHDQELDRKIALKMLLPSSENNVATSGGRTRLLREAQALAKLSHPNVVGVHDVGTLGDRVWMAMELVTGQTIGAWARAGLELRDGAILTNVRHVVRLLVPDPARGHPAVLDVAEDLERQSSMPGEDGDESAARTASHGAGVGETGAAQEPSRSREGRGRR